jgi:hypothetical protein
MPIQHEGDFCGELLETLVHRLHDRADCRGRRRRGGLRGTEELSQELKANYRAPGFNGSFEFWVTGTMSPKGKKDLQARGFSVVEQAGTRIDIVN